jgi:hypothetical protein
VRQSSAVGLVITLSLLACSKAESTPSTAAGEANELDAGKLGAVHAAPDRVVAIGDLHGDLDAARRALRLAGAIDGKDAWIGGTLVVVQTGDEIDRGDQDREILDLFERLESDARATGGEVIALAGNHEIMNAMFDFRYATKGGFAEFDGVQGAVPAIKDLPPEDRGRAIAFNPGGPYAKMRAKRPVVARVGDSIFVHGGVLQKHVKKGLDGINVGMRAFFEGTVPAPPSSVTDDDGLVWTRAYSEKTGSSECEELAGALAMLHAKRMVVGHTPQDGGMNTACNGQVVRIDVGMSKFYGGPIQVLQITKDGVSALHEN